MAKIIKMIPFSIKEKEDNIKKLEELLNHWNVYDKKRAIKKLKNEQ